VILNDELFLEGKALDLRKPRAGHVLDGVEHTDMPAVQQ
jgi:hypothetical protein